MAFISKEELASEAQRLGVNLDDYESWSDKQKAVFAAQQLESMAPKNSTTTNNEVEENADAKQAGIERMKKNFKDGKVRISTEMKAVKYQVHKYEEPLGYDVEVEEMEATPDMIENAKADGVASGTYVIKRKSGRRVVAQSTLPIENVSITFDSARDVAPVAEYDGRRGYLWTHPTLFGIKDLLIESGYYEKYKEKFDGTKYPTNIWYAGTKFLVCSIPLVHYIFTEIEDDARKRFMKSGN